MGLWVLHISQPGRLGVLMKVQDGQDHPGWRKQGHSCYSLCPYSAQTHPSQGLAHLKGTGEASTRQLRGTGHPQRLRKQAA